jgi:hypothetical protein
MTPEQNKTVNSALIIFCKTLYQLNSERTDKKLAPVQIECIDLPLITLEEKTLKKLFLCNHFIKAIAIDCSNIHELLNFSTPKKSNRSEFICKKFRGRNWQTVLHEVAKQGRLELCRSIVNLAPELIHRLDIHGRTPCWYAAHAGLIESVKFFIEECNLPLDHCDDFGRTLLHAAALGGHYDVAEYLIIKNIDINETIKKECRKSIKNGSPDSRKLFLLFGGQDEDAPNNLPNNQNNQNIPAQRGGNGNDRATQWILTPTKICIAAIVLLFPLLLKYYGAALFQKKISRSLNTALQWIRPTHNTPNQK